MASKRRRSNIYFPKLSCDTVLSSAVSELALHDTLSRKGAFIIGIEGNYCYEIVMSFYYVFRSLRVPFYILRRFAKVIFCFYWGVFVIKSRLCTDGFIWLINVLLC